MVHCFIVFQVPARDPFVVLRPITAPPDEVLEVLPKSLAIYDFLDHMFRHSIHFNWPRFVDCSAWELDVIVRLERLDVVECWLLTELKFPLTTPSTIFSDNQSSIAIAHHPEFHTRTKHIDISTHFLCDHVKQGNLDLYYINTNLLGDLASNPT